jgi:hypothetical protein
MPSSGVASGLAANLKTPVNIGSRFSAWRVSWLGGRTGQRLAYIVMIVPVIESSPEPRSAIIEAPWPRRISKSDLRGCLPDRVQGNGPSYQRTLKPN